jgi:flagellar export protein FliJ
VKQQQLQLVKDQAEIQQRDLSERFEKALAFVQQERNQLSQLQAYKAEYLQKIEQNQHQWSAANSTRYRHFCHKLAQAIQDQEGKLRQAEKQLDTLRESLCQQQQRLNVLDDLIDRQLLEEAYHQNRLVQKEMDELSNRRAISN